MKFRPSIRVRLFVAFLCILLISFSTLFYRSVQNLEASLEELIEAELETNLRYAWHEYFSVSEMLRYSLLQPTTSPQVKGLIARRDTRGLAEIALGCRSNLPSADFLVIVDAAGNVLAGAGEEQPGVRFGLANIVDRALRERQPVVATEAASSMLLSREGRERLGTAPSSHQAGQQVLIQTVALPIRSDDGRIIGGIVAGGLVNRDARLPLQVRKILGSDVEISITQGAERIVSSLGERSPATISPVIMKKLEEGLSYRGRAVIGKEMFLTAFQPLANSYGHTVGSLSVALSLDSFQKIRKDHIRNMGFAAAIGVILSFVLSWFAARQLTKPLIALAQSTRLVREGDLDQQVDARSGGELGELEESFNAMTAALREREETIRGQNDQLRKLNQELEDRVKARTFDLQREKSRLETILTSLAEGLIVVDRESLVVLLNPAAQKLFATIPSRIIGKPLELLCESESFFLLLNYLSSIEGKASTVSVVEERVKACDKEMIFRVSPLLDTQGDYAGMVLAVRDITAEADMERMKGEFYSAVSHEFKTPLTSMKGSLELLMGSSQVTGDREKSLLGICLRNTDRLISLTGEILDIARISAGNVLFVFESVRLAEVIEQALEDVGGAIRSREIAIVTKLDPTLPSVFGDRGRLVKIFTNLISNALGSSATGGSVEIVSYREGNYLLVEIADHGTGVNRPGRISSWDSDEVAGTGLGLSLCLEIIREHHGRLEYLAGSDGGTVVRVTLPLGEEL